MTKVKEDWFKSWFNTHYYHILYKHRDNAEANTFIGNLVQKIQLREGMYVADICCGKGRHSIELSQYQLRVWGMDLSENSIEEARANGNFLTKFDVHDIRVPFPETNFNAIFNLFTSFGYFEDTQDDLLSLNNIANALMSNGNFIQDYIHADYFTRNFPISEIKTIDSVKFEIEKYVENGYIIKQIQVFDQDHSETFYEKVKIYSLDELRHLHELSGFVVENVWGDYGLSAFSAKESQRIILNSRKL